MLLCIYLGELGAKQKYLRSVVDPRKQYNQRSRSLEGLGNAALAYVQPDK